MVSPVSSGFGANLAQMMRSQALENGGKTGSAQGAQQPQSKEGQSIQETLAALEKIIQELMALLQKMGINPAGAAGGGEGAGGSAPAIGRDGGGGGGAPGARDGFSQGGGKAAPQGMGALDGAGGAANAGAAGGASVQGIQVSDPRLRRALEQIASHPDGAKLLQAAKANGLDSISVNRGLNPDGGAGTAGETSWGNGRTRIEIADPNSPNLIHTLAHELGHAASTGDGNSMLEEKTVDALGEKIQRDLTGRGSSFDLNEGAYGGLSGNNGILETLRRLGVNV